MRKVYSHSKRTTLEKCPLQCLFEYYAQSVELPSCEKQLTMFSSLEPGHRVMTAEQIAQAAELRALSNAFQATGLILHQLLGQHWEHADWDDAWFIRQAAERYDKITTSEPMHRAENLTDSGMEVFSGRLPPLKCVGRDVVAA